MTPSIGRIVHYTLTASDADQINRRRADTVSHTSTRTPDGAQVHVGNPVNEGHVYPLIITRVWSVHTGAINGQVLLDGNDSLWVTSRTESKTSGAYEPGTYTWPTRN